MGMRNDGQKQQLLQQGGGVGVGVVGGRTNGFLPTSFRAISSYLRIVSSGASTVARSAASVASSIVDRDDVADHDQVCESRFYMILGDIMIITFMVIIVNLWCIGLDFNDFYIYRMLIFG